MKNDTVKDKKYLTRQYIILFVLLCSSVLTGCMDGYYEQPDNKLKPSPCACAEVVWDSRVIG